MIEEGSGMGIPIRGVHTMWKDANCVGNRFSTDGTVWSPRWKQKLWAQGEENGRQAWPDIEMSDSSRGMDMTAVNELWGWVQVGGSGGCFDGEAKMGSVKDEGACCARIHTAIPVVCGAAVMLSVSSVVCSNSVSKTYGDSGLEPARADKSKPRGKGLGPESLEREAMDHRMNPKGMGLEQDWVIRLQVCSQLEYQVT